MFKLDDAFLQEIGLGGLPAADKQAMLRHIYETLEMRVGVKLAEQMSNEQLDEFEGYINKNDEAGALKWLETNFPNYKDVVAQQLDVLKQEVKTSAPQILQASIDNQQPQQQVSPTDYAQQLPVQQPAPISDVPFQQPSPDTSPQSQDPQSPIDDQAL